MASNRRPRISFNVTYGAIGQQSTARMLNPVLIAPRYSLHSYEDGYEDARLKNSSGEEVTYTAGTALTNLPWPGALGEGAVIDTNSAAVYLKDATMRFNSTGVTLTKVTGESLAYTIPKETITDLDEAKIGLKVGDSIVSGTTRSFITAIEATYESPEPKASIEKCAGTTSTEAVSVITTTEYELPPTKCVYLVKIAHISDDKTGATIQVTAIEGDAGFSYSYESGGGSAEVAFRELDVDLGSISSHTVGDSYLVTRYPQTITTYNKIYVDTTIPTATLNSCFIENTRLMDEYTRVAATCVNAGITIAATVNVVIGEASYQVGQGIPYVVYREQLTADAMEIVASSDTHAAAWAGIADKQNPMGLMYAAASQVSNGFFYMMSTPGATEDDYINTIEYAAQYEDLYAFVPYNCSEKIRAAAINIINNYAQPTIAKFKRLWAGSIVEDDLDIYSKDSSGSSLLASISKTSGELTLNSSSADLISGGVKAGHYVEVQGEYDQATATYITYQYKVTEVVSSSKAKLDTTDLKDFSTTKVRFVKHLTNTEYAKKVAEAAKNINNHRVNLVWADTVNFGTILDIELSVLCAVLATLRASLPPHAPLSEVQIPGITISNTKKLLDSHYDIMNDGGIWVVAEDSDGTVVTLHQITTKTDGTIAEEDSCVSGGDAIIRHMRTALKGYASGKANVSYQLLDAIRAKIAAESNYLMGLTYDYMYGPIMTDYEILELYIPESNKASIIATIKFEMPQPLLDGIFTFNLV